MFKIPLFEIDRLLLLSLLGVCLTACGGGGGNDGSSKNQSSSKASSSSVASSSSSSSAISVTSLAALADFPVGVAVSAGNEQFSILKQNDNGEAQREVVETHFSEMVAGNIMKMSYLHPQEDTYTFEQADALINYAETQGIEMHGHALVWHPDYQVPDWMKNYEGDKNAWLAMIAKHSTKIATHFAGRLNSWDVVNEAFEDNGSYRNSLFFQKMGKDYIETAFTAARAGDPDADLYYNDYNLSQSATKIDAVITMVKDFQEREIPIDGIGFQMHIQLDYPSIATIKAHFKKAADTGLKVRISELDIPLNNPYGERNNYDELTPALEQEQKVRYCEVVEAYMDTVPAAQRGGITVWGIWDSSSWLITLPERNKQDWPLLFDDNFQAKPALAGFADGLQGNACN